MYENIRRSAKGIHAQMGSETSTWFFEYDADHTVIVHAADMTNEGCVSCADRMRGKQIQDLFSDRGSIFFQRPPFWSKLSNRSRLRSFFATSGEKILEKIR